MIITTVEPYSSEEVKKLSEEFGEYIKVVLDVSTKKCSAGCKMHADSEKDLIESGSNQSDLWGGGIDLTTLVVDFTSFINIRPNQDNSSNEILNAETRRQFETLIKHFFSILYDK